MCLHMRYLGTLQYNYVLLHVLIVLENQPFFTEEEEGIDSWISFLRRWSNDIGKVWGVLMKFSRQSVNFFLSNLYFLFQLKN